MVSQVLEVSVVPEVFVVPMVSFVTPQMPPNHNVKAACVNSASLVEEVPQIFTYTGFFPPKMIPA